MSFLFLSILLIRLSNAAYSFGKTRNLSGNSFFVINTFCSSFGNLDDRCAKSSLSSFSVFSGNCSFHFLYSSFYFRLNCFVSCSFVSFTKILFLADLMLANAYTSKYIYDFKCNLSFRRLGHGRSAETYSFILCQL